MLPPGKPLKVCSSEPALRPPEQPRVCRPRAPTPRRLGEGLSTAVARGPPWLGSATSRRALPRRGLNGGAASTCRKGDGHRHSPVGSQRGSVPSPRPPQESYRREPQSRTCSPAEGHHVRLGLGGVRWRQEGTEETATRLPTPPQTQGGTDGPGGWWEEAPCTSGEAWCGPTGTELARYRPPPPPSSPVRRA